MMISSSAVQFESPIEIGPCNLNGVLNQFYYESSSFPYTLKVQGEAYASLCVTFLGDEPSRGAELVLGPCENEAKFGWDFIPEASLGKPTMVPTTSLPRLRYLGRDACTVDSPCDACYGDCDNNEDCNKGLQCFQRERGDSTQVPGCAVGGAGDIPGADYCYEGSGPTPSTSPTPSSQPPPLEWLGSRGCSTETPCPICVGDCNVDDDCENLLSCFKRGVGGDTPVPGCAVGGLGDIPGGDYCHNPNSKKLESSPNDKSDTAESKPNPTPQTITDFISSSNGMTTIPQSAPTAAFQTAKDTPRIPAARPDVNLNDDTNSSPETTTTSTQVQSSSKSNKSSKSSSPKKLSTNQ